MRLYALHLKTLFALLICLNCPQVCIKSIIKRAFLMRDTYTLHVVVNHIQLSSEARLVVWSLIMLGKQGVWGVSQFRR